MSHLTSSGLGADELDKLCSMAAMIQADCELDGHAIAEAVALHQSFGETRHVASAAARRFIVTSASSAARRADLWPESAPGSGLDVVVPASNGTTLRVARVKSYSGSADTPLFTEKDPSTLFDVDDGGFYVRERWVFGYRLDGNLGLGGLLIARALGIEPGSPGYLRLSDVTPLTGSNPVTPGRGFTSSDDDLDDFASDGDAAGDQSA